MRYESKNQEMPTFLNLEFLISATNVGLARLTKFTGVTLGRIDRHDVIA